MILTRPLLVLDVEGTGLDTQTEAIWEVGFSVLLPDGTDKQWSKRFKPWKALSPEAEEKCKIKTADLDGEPPISDYIAKIFDMIRGKDLAGYNLRNYDLPLIDEEGRRCGLKLDLAGVQIVDVLGTYRKKKTRTLTDCVREYCGEDVMDEFESGAHGAGHDALWTMRAMQGQVLKHADLEEMDLAQLAAFSRYGDFDYVDFAGKLYRDKDGDIAYAFGKDKDKKVRDCPSYGFWMLKQSFSGNTLDALHAEMKRLKLL